VKVMYTEIRDETQKEQPFRSTKGILPLLVWFTIGAGVLLAALYAVLFYA